MSHNENPQPAQFPAKRRHSGYECQTAQCGSHVGAHDVCILRPTDAMLEFGLEVLQRPDAPTWAVNCGGIDYDLEKLERLVNALEEAQQLVALADAGIRRNVAA
ncbi:hypothetical protein C5E10_05260 [Pseudoclavibacter sp. RFBG4]|uniref:hypothetical protein n=1 Tax=Pseudoclavibacter sp. RFBG4 TaxID=2080575 RepID=UPI000CE7DF8E|nr:hypothetical protein [Pseudoclavibacter sp. RFBG4]PPG35012.1 hypothetical protein C5E10_05260 [Pseudoclavibacter sp. RFBG4]